MRVKWLFLICLVATSMVRTPATEAQQSSPIIFFTDIIAGANSGNSDTTYGSSGGVYVTIYGNYLDNYSSVQLNGSSCLTVVQTPETWLWYERMIVKLGTSCTSGNFSITTPGGTWSGPAVATTNAATLLSGDSWPTIDFTVCSGAIHYLNYSSGNDSNAGSYSSPWQHAYYALDTDGPGKCNVDYFMGGTSSSSPTIYLGDNDTWGAIITPRPEYSKGTVSQPNAMVGYPGQFAQIGQEGAGCENGIRSTDMTGDWIVANAGYWTFAELIVRALDGTSGCGSGPVEIAGGDVVDGWESRGWRFIALDVASPTGGDNAITPFQPNLTSYDQTFGNNIHDITLLATTRLDQALYLSTDANLQDVGWNYIYHNEGRGGVQIHSSPLCWPSCGSDKTGFALHDIWLHDNQVNDTANECILVDTPAPQTGNGIRVYNNLFWNCGAQTGANFATGWEYSGDPCTIGSSPAPIWWYNNTVYQPNATVPSLWGEYFYPADDCGSSMTVNVILVNNILQTPGALSGAVYLDAELYAGENTSECASTATPSQCQVAGANNVEYGLGSPTFTSLLINTVNSDAQFVSPSSGQTANFNLQSSSPAIGAGLHTINDYINSGYSVTAPTYDINGLVRPNPPSIGAYEYSSGTAATPPAPPSGLTATVN